MSAPDNAHRLPLLGASRAHTELCGYCPKLCRPACPVSTVEGRESVTPWGKMRALGEWLGGASEIAPRAQRAWACTGCLHCRELCLLDNPVADTLSLGRAEALAAGYAPPEVTAFLEDLPRRAERLEACARRLGPGDADAATAWVPGCTSVVRETDHAEEVSQGIRRLAVGARVVADVCCGAPLWDAGDRQGFARQAERFAQRVQGRVRVVVGDPGCAYALKVLYPRVGVALPLVEHVSELALRERSRLSRRSDPEVPVYHDACKLGRGLGLFDAPRSVLEHLTGSAPDELDENRSRANCSGGGALLPVTRGATADALGRSLAEAVIFRHGPGRVVVTACASSRQRLRQAGVRAEDLSHWIARGVR
ncbi:MAG: (Fe-S)-binding protein [Deltaproteobacteria bacterium]|nr:(Fe-S)-binding protein [Deltaproteobacteria bacterium]